MKNASCRLARDIYYTGGLFRYQIPNNSLFVHTVGVFWYEFFPRMHTG